MPATYLDINKGSGYGEVIEKIIEARRAPIKAKEEEKKEQLKISVLKDLQKELGNLEQFSGRLYGFNSIFDEFKVTSDAPDVLTGSARRGTKPGEYTLKVVRAALAHRIASREVSDKENLPASDFSLLIGEKRFDFKWPGGNLQALQRFFERRADLQKILSASSVKKTADKSVLVLASEKTGSMGRIQLLSDTGHLFTALEFFGKSTLVSAKPEDRLFGISNLTGGSHVRGETEAFVLEPESSFRAPSVGNLSFAPGDALEWTIGWEWIAPAPTNAEKVSALATNLLASGSPLKTDLAIGLSDKIALDGDILTLSLLTAFDRDRLAALGEESLQRERERKALEELKAQELKKNPPKNPVVDPLAVRVKYTAGSGGEEKEKVFSLSGDFTNQTNGSAAFSFLAENPDTQVQDIAFINGNTSYRYRVRYPELKRKPPSNAAPVSPYKPLHEVDAPQTAVFEYKGVRVEREGNLVGDLIEGLTLEVKKAVHQDVRIKVEWNEEAIDNQVVTFVGQYNIIMEMINQILNSEKPGPEIKDDVKPRYGLYRNELVFQLLKDKLRRIGTDAHPTSQPEVLALLTQVGISPIYVRGNPNDINVGKFDYKEDIFKKWIRENPKLVEELFAFDGDQDRIPEVGAGVDAVKLARNYSGPTGVIAGQKDTSERRIKQLDQDIKQETEKLDVYRKKLLQEFTDLEAAQKEFERQQKYLDNVNGSK